MHIYFSGIGGVGIGPLAQIALDAGYTVSGSDIAESELTKALAGRADVAIGQDGTQIGKAHSKQPIDWFVYTAALPPDHPELKFASDHNIRISKRDELLAQILDDQNIRMIAVAGTHGKTTTTAMLVWIAQKIGLPVSYLVGTTLPFGPSGKLDKASPYFFYECDEYDRNFLHFNPHLSLITSVDYDHPDTYETESDYKSAFVQFLSQSEHVVAWQTDARYISGEEEGGKIASKIRADFKDSNLIDYSVLDEISYPPLQYVTLPGLHNRKNASLAVTAISRIAQAENDEAWSALIDAINTFPGTGRRFEKLADNLYSDYGHHPKEIAATLQLARELSDEVVLVYQPHQNTRQHHVKAEYENAFIGAEKIYWLPTYLTREDPSLPVLEPADFISTLSNKANAVTADLNDELWQDITKSQADGKLVLLMGAGTIDAWIRKRLES